MNITEAQAKDSDLLAEIVSVSNRDVAQLFHLTIDNAAKHPSFCTPEWIVSECERGQRYFLYTDKGIAMGCVAYEQPNENTSYLNRLSVLPEHRRQGIGAELVSHIVEFSRQQGVSQVSIGIIAEYTQLKLWYQKLGFKEGAQQKFEHLPFTVLYMHYAIE